MKIGFIGLGKMGANMVTRLLQGGHQVVVNDHHQEAIDQAVSEGAEAATSREELAQKLATTAIVWLMIPAAAVDAEIDALLKLLPRGSIIIDGGNSDFRDTRKRYAICQAAGIELIDVGTSGGILGLKDGYCMMAGGDQATFTTIEPFIQALAQENGYKYFGPTGAGHYIKMTHNAIEYAMMEAYAEGYHFLKNGQDYPGLDLAGVASVWQQGSIIASSLNGLAGAVFTANPELAGIDGYVAESGEARWTLEVAKNQRITLPAIQAALDDRIASEQGTTNFGTKLLAAMRNAFGGHKLNK